MKKKKHFYFFNWKVSFPQMLNLITINELLRFFSFDQCVVDKKKGRHDMVNVYFGFSISRAC